MHPNEIHQRISRNERSRVEISSWANGLNAIASLRYCRHGDGSNVEDTTREGPKSLKISDDVINIKMTYIGVLVSRAATTAKGSLVIQGERRDATHSTHEEFPFSVPVITTSCL
jgi:hypothetical protein